MKTNSLGEFEELVLLTVATQHDQAYGVSVKQSLDSLLKKQVNIGSIHVALKRLREKGLVESRFGGITSQRGGRRKKFYTITLSGKHALDRNYALRTGLYLQIPNINFG